MCAALVLVSAHRRVGRILPAWVHALWRLFTRLGLLFVIRAATALFQSVRALVAPLHARYRSLAPPSAPLLPPAAGAIAPAAIPAARLAPTAAAAVLAGVAGFSFRACSWMMFYHLGVARALHDALGAAALGAVRFGGASSGALMAAALACEVPLAGADAPFRAFAFGLVDFAAQARPLQKP